jgi:hypothetical protein
MSHLILSAAYIEKLTIQNSGFVSNNFIKLESIKSVKVVSSYHL